MHKFRKGDYISHNVFGFGIVLEDQIDNKVKVLFDRLDIGKKTIVDSFINPINAKSLFGEDTTQGFETNKNYNNSIIAIPRKYSDSPFFSKEDRDIYRHTIKNLNRGFVSIGTNPLAMTDRNKIGLIIHPSYGVFIFSIFDKVSDYSIFLQVNKIIIENYITVTAVKIKKYLEDKRVFRNSDFNYSLNFPLMFGAIFPNISYEEHKEDIDNLDLGDFIFYQEMKNTFYETVNHFLYTKKRTINSSYKEISEELALQIINKIHPEYSVSIIESTHKTLRNQEKVSTIDVESRIKACLLDEEQIHLINDMKNGYYLTLANPGTGKSVVLLSQAYRMSCIQNEPVLITCYNRNLRDRYSIMKDISGFNNRDNLKIFTFHQLLKRLIENINPGFQYDENHPELFEQASLIVTDYLEKNGPLYYFKAIFIDEIQLFDSKWIDICYKLLAKPIEESYLQMYGDLNQDVRAAKRKGKASWQQTNLDFRGRVRTFNKNYRNTKQIHEYLQSMLSVIHSRIMSLDLSISLKDMDNGLMVAEKKGKLPQIYHSQKTTLVLKLYDIIKSLSNQSDITYADIAILYPFRAHKLHNYYPIENLQDMLNNSNIPFTEISGDDKQKLFESNGLTFCTIDSSLGLDFKVVILTALYPLNYTYQYNGAIKFPHISQLNKSNQSVLDDFIKYSRQIYTAASRAREILIIVNDLGKDSIFHQQIIVPGRDIYEYYQ